MLVGPQQAGNIGMVARAMKNFGLDDLWLVAPETPLTEEAYKFAVGARDLLEKARETGTLDEALQGVHWVAATTARPRDEYPGEPVTPRQVAPFLKGAAEAGQEVALVFGRERSGLTNAELDRAQFVVKIPTTAFKSLNLAQAVLVMAYELFTVDAPAQTAPAPAPREKLETFFADLARYLIEIGYTDEKRLPHVMRAFRRVLHRAAPSEGEFSLIWGLIRQGRWAMQRRVREGA